MSVGDMYGFLHSGGAMTGKFSYEVAGQLKAYVYRLIDPRCGETFYVGKGRGDRVFQHALEACVPAEDEPGIMSPKLDRIREIRSANVSVEYVIHRHGMDDDTAYQVEAALIDAYPSLHNAVRGHHASIYGMATVEGLLQRYNLPQLALGQEHKLLAITINKLRGRRDHKVIFDLIRYCWPLRQKRAETVEYVLAVDRGVAVGVFKPLRWKPARAADFPDIANIEDEMDRLAFQGERAPQDIWDFYVGEHGKRISPIDLPPARQACRYINC
ncbi:LEM-3-like GIY-YIG domain-containing protein [Mesorhizobium shangrilense]|uniref:GIY-YIG domain-containing protein n=1 Tax=Mesorhizobium shangrilense TaxID=460060 RepID=A0ABV2DEP5_9HYPH